MAAVELHVNATYAEYLALKSVYGKDQSVIMPGKLFSSYVLYRAVLSTGSSQDFKTGELNCFYKSTKHSVLLHYHRF